jgi:hypothetical protein
MEGLIGWILMPLLIGGFVAVLPRWSYSKEWSNTPAIGIAVCFVVLLFAKIFGMFPY